MDSCGRHVNPSLSELIDRLTVDQIKEILIPKGNKSFAKEIEHIEYDLDMIFSQSDYVLTSRLIRLVVALAQVNLHIWNAKERMMNDPERFYEHLKLSHQLNGIRNQLKNDLLEKTGIGEHSSAKTNVDTENLKGWNISVLSDHAFSNSSDPCCKLEERKYRFLLTDLIDTLTINQIKEVFFTGEKRLNIVKETEKIALDMDICLNDRSVKPKGSLIGLIIFLAQANLHIWLNKDLMQHDKMRYDKLLDFAQDLNGIRNQVRNTLMREFDESEPCNTRAIFLRRDESKWYSQILDRLNIALTDSQDSLLTITANDLTHYFALDEPELADDCREILRTRDFRYRKLEYSSRDAIVRDVVKRIVSGDFWISGKDKQHIWEDGWSENLEEYQDTKDILNLTPKFLQSKKVLRLGREYIEPVSRSFEFDIVDIFRRSIFRKYLSGVAAIYEFGCGSCQHLPVLAELFPDKEIHGLDWAQASIKIIDKLVQEKGWKIDGHIFDLFSPDQGFELTKGSGIFTMGTMEQLGRDFEPFLQFLITKKPAVVFHIESMAELYDEDNLLDYLAKIYDGKRNYLTGLIHRLQELERGNEIDLIDIKRVYFGSMFHDSYSLVAWRPRSL